MFILFCLFLFVLIYVTYNTYVISNSRYIAFRYPGISALITASCPAASIPDMSHSVTHTIESSLGHPQTWNGIGQSRIRNFICIIYYI